MNKKQIYVSNTKITANKREESLDTVERVKLDAWTACLPSLPHQGIIVHGCNPSIQEEEDGGSDVQDPREVEATLGYSLPYF